MVIVMRQTVILASLLLHVAVFAQNRDPAKTEIVTTDLDNFWKAFDVAAPDFKPEILQREYLDKGSVGLAYFLKNKIRTKENLSKVIAAHRKYYSSVRESTEKIPAMADRIRQSLVKLKDLYPKAIFPPVYFAIGAMNSGGTASDDGLIIGAEMYGLTPNSPTEELNDWMKSVFRPVEEVPHIVAHELIHFQQDYRTQTLLEACLREGSADFIAELISGKHINHHVHDFANPKEKELWSEFLQKMNEKDFAGWLYSQSPGRPNDLGYWMGYQITKAYYDRAADKKQAIADILRIRNAKKFLEESRYEDRFK